MHVLVTGGGGFVGRHVVARLCSRADRVRVLGRRAYPDLAAEGVECVRGDLTDSACVREACQGVDAVFHIGAKAGVWGPYEEYRAINLDGTRNVLDACAAQGVQRLVYTSTPSVVYGRAPIDGGDESLPYPARYLTAYAETKALAERSVIAANGTDGLCTCALRPHLIWGPGDTNLIPRIVERARAGRLVRVGDGQNRISVSYVENIADAHLAACDRLAAGSPVCGQCYFVNDREPVNCWGFIEEVVARVGAPAIRRSLSARSAYCIGAVLECVYRALRLRGEPLMTRFLALQLSTSHWFRIDKAARDLGWEPDVAPAEGLERLVETFPRS